MVLGATLGALAGYYGGRFDRTVLGAYTIWLAIPYIIFFVVWQAFFGRSMSQMILVIVLVNWTAGLLIVRGQVMMLKNREFVDAARMLGMSDLSIIFRHLAPNILWVVVIYTSLVIPEVIMMESLVSFLGVGIQEPNTSIGRSPVRRGQHHDFWHIVAVGLSGSNLRAGTGFAFLYR